MCGQSTELAACQVNRITVVTGDGVRKRPKVPAAALAVAPLPDRGGLRRGQPATLFWYSSALRRLSHRASTTAGESHWISISQPSP